MPEPYPHQRLALESTDLIRVVSAVPGSGKTWLIAEKMRRALVNWPETKRHQGIAALSFTNVARDEICSALGYAPSHPHFVGTLDSFVFKFIIRPFGHFYESGLKYPKLVPAECAEALANDQSWFQSDSRSNRRNLAVPLSGNKRIAHVFTSYFVKEEDHKPILAAQTSKWSGIEILNLEDSAKVLARKKEVWKKSGRVSHSDCAFIATQLLNDEDHGPQLKKLITARFPGFIVDELQDTGWYLSQVLTSLLSFEKTRAFLVGDPDQAIYEFTGASPEYFGTFSRIPGAVKFSMNFSRRCPPCVRQAAEHLCLGERQISGEDSGGKAVLLHYDGDGFADVREFALRAAGADYPIRILVRKNSHLAKVRGSHGAAQRSSLIERSPPLRNIHKAVLALKDGKTQKALALAGCSLGRVLFNADHVHASTLHEQGIEESQWNEVIREILFEGYREVEGEDLHNWCLRMRDALGATLDSRNWTKERFGYRLPNRPTESKIKGEAVWEEESANERSPLLLDCSTVHGAKGETHENTLFFVPNDNREDHCPSLLWWSRESEERRIAFVACTRPTNALFLCIHEDTLERLKEWRAEFVAAFEVASIKSFEFS